MDNSIDLLITNKNKKALLLLFFLLPAFALYAQRQSTIVVEANIQESSCASQGHVISLNVNGGEGPYTYRWRDGVSGSFRKDLTGGTYVCEVQDTKGSKVSKTFSLAQLPLALELGYELEKSADGTSNISLKVTGGIPPYSFYWIGQGIDLESTRKQNKVEGLKKGIYHIAVQDSKECAASVTVNLK